MMLYSILIGKILGDKNSRKLGLIVDIKYPVDTLEGDGDSTFLVVRVEHPFGKEEIVQIKAKFVSKVQDIYVWLSITKKDFMKLTKESPEA